MSPPRVPCLPLIEAGKGIWRADSTGAGILPMLAVRTCPAFEENHPEMQIRILRAADAGVLTSVAPDVFDDSLIPSAGAEFLSDPRHHLVVAIDAGVVVGFVSAVHYVHPDKPAELWINEVGVAPSHQRQGIARAMLHTMLEHARGLDCREAWVLTDAGNTPARRLYASIDGARESDAHVMYTFPLSPRSHEQS